MITLRLMALAIAMVMPVELPAQQPRPGNFVSSGTVRSSASPTSNMFLITIAEADAVNRGFLIELMKDAKPTQMFNEWGEAEYQLGQYLKISLRGSKRQVVFVEGSPPPDVKAEAYRVVGMARMAFDFPSPKDHAAIAAQLFERHKTLPRRR